MSETPFAGLARYKDSWDGARRHPEGEYIDYDAAVERVAELLAAARTEAAAQALRLAGDAIYDLKSSPLLNATTVAVCHATVLEVARGLAAREEER